jgi:hypothetical protein
MLLKCVLALALSATVACETAQADEDTVVVTGPRIASSVAALCSAQPGAEQVSPNSPHPQEISALEASVELPPGAHPLADYNRFYAYVHNEDGLTVVGSYALTAHGQHQGCVRSFSDAKLLPGVVGGGCSFIHVWWAVETKKITGAVCNFAM